MVNFCFWKKKLQVPLGNEKLSDICGREIFASCVKGLFVKGKICVSVFNPLSYSFISRLDDGNITSYGDIISPEEKFVTSNPVYIFPDLKDTNLFFLKPPYFEGPPSSHLITPRSNNFLRLDDFLKKDSFYL